MIVAFVDDLMDRSRVRAALGDDVAFVRRVEDARDAELVLVDLTRHAGVIPPVRRLAPDARVVAFGPHVDDTAFAAARAAGADVVLARSRFFRDVAAAVSPATDR